MPLMRSRTGVLALAGVLTAVLAVEAENWPQFRGARGGVAPDDPALPETWSTTENVAWALDVPGRSWSSPVVWGDHVFVTTAIDTAGDKPLRPTSEYISRSGGGTMTFQDLEKTASAQRWMVYDVDFRTGKVRWEREAATGVPAQPRHQKNSYAAETPVTDGERVYAYFGNVGLFAFDLTGKPVWSQKVATVKTRTGFGSAASPILHDDRVILVNDNDDQSYIAAYDKRTGRELWRTDRDEGSNWATPFVWQNDRRTEIVTAGTDMVRSYGLDGQLLWELKGMSIYSIPTPFAADGLLYITSGYPADKIRPVYAIRPGAMGDISLKPDQASNDFIVWSNPLIGPYNPSPLVYRGCYYTLLDRGFLTCHDPKTGQEIYGRQRITMDATSFTASLWAYNGRVFALSEDGDTYVIQAGPEFKVVGKNSLGEMSMATPAVANGSLIVRTANKLYRITRASASR
jgi:outer membrane protein assembly factor BamB